ncbi:MAG: sigma-54 factor interaction domain-containing protein [Gemmatimonadaceae bacterium]|nr:sigma-54 factor interaction domain-containing protein [Gemmatimonadaceae bacterium]
MLLVRLSVAEQQWSVEFYSRQPYAFRAADAPIARRIADHIALALSHEHLANFARETEKARVRAEQLEARVNVLSQQLDARVGSGRIVGESPEWKAVLKQAAQVAVTEATVLLTGESGTGKEVIACFIHRGSARNAGPFLALNCATVPEHLFESELFGYERGAFTGAHQSKPGQRPRTTTSRRQLRRDYSGKIFTTAFVSSRFISRRSANGTVTCSL